MYSLIQRRTKNGKPVDQNQRKSDQVILKILGINVDILGIPSYLVLKN